MTKVSLWTRFLLLFVKESWSYDISEYGTMGVCFKRMNGILYIIKYDWKPNPSPNGDGLT